MSAMIYKGYYAAIVFDADDNVFAGRIGGISDQIVFEGRSVSELKQAFEHAVDDHLDTCARRGREARKPSSGRLTIRVAPELHNRISISAQVSGISLNQWAERALAKAAEGQLGSQVDFKDAESLMSVKVKTMLRQ